jgi:putative GTP pyrophosphokinase
MGRYTSINIKAKKVSHQKSPPYDINRQEFFQKYNISEIAFRQTGLAWDTLEWIYAKHMASFDSLRATGNYIVEQLRQVKAVHSIKIRVKNPEHLVEKIIRKCSDQKNLKITPDNYEGYITDLVGIRALHLFKDEWLPIHEFVCKTWELKEKPIANVREGDSENIRQQFKEHGCKINVHPFGYRSVHYLLNSQPSKRTVIAELQVRTLFEEGWSEIDHQVRYPYYKEDIVLADFLLFFNRLAGSADEMGSFIKALRVDRVRTLKEMQRARKSLEAKNVELRKVIGELKISNQAKKELQKKVDDLSHSSVMSVGSVTFTPSAKFTPLNSYPFLGASGKDVLFPKRRCIKCGKEFFDFSFPLQNLCSDCRK